MTAGRFVVAAEHVGSEIQNLRLAARLTEAELATLLNMPVVSIREIERGEGGVSIGTLYSLADALETTLDRLYENHKK